MRIISTLDEMNETARGWLAAGTVGFVPTMGHLHEGHLTLLRAAREECEISIVSIFVNPLQFSSDAQLARYPRDLERDLQLLSNAQTDVVFIPRSEDMYPPAFATYITPTGAIAERQEGAGNTGYIRGVATVMTKLFQIVRPDVAYFGQKDAQQVAVVRQLVRDLNIDVSLRILPTVRECDEVAMSSRNIMLSQEERRAARVIYQALLAGKAFIERGEWRPWVIEQAMADLVMKEPLVRLEYAAVCDPDTFTEVRRIAPGTLLAIAAHIGNTRLIDNVVWMSDGQWRV